MNILIQDLRYAMRTLLKKPLFASIVIITLSLGIGANTAIFSVVNAVILKPLPYPNPEALMMVWETVPQMTSAHNDVSPANFLDWREQNSSFEQVAAFTGESLSLTGRGEPERIEGERVSANLFPLLGIAPFLGNGFTSEDDRYESPRVVVLSHHLWQRRFQSDTAIIGQTLTLNGVPHTVVGVMPSYFQFPDREQELWVPLAFHPQEAAGRGDHYLRVLGRLRSGVSRAQAQVELNTIASHLEQRYPQTNSDTGVALVPLHDEVADDLHTPLLILLGVVGFVLAVACANVINLLLARAASRQKEMAIRAALGAGRWRLGRQLVTESMLLAMIGGVAGMVLAVWGVDLLESLVPSLLAQAQGIPIDSRVFGFTFAISLLTGFIFGLVPAVQVSKPRLNEVMKEGTRGTAYRAGDNRLRNLLVVTEVALALVLLVGAGLMAKSLLRLTNVQTGFQSEKLLTMQMQIPAPKYANPVVRRAFYDQVLEGVAALPGVQSAGVISYTPLTFTGMSFVFSLQGQPPLPSSNLPSAVFRVVSPDYFRTMGIPLIDGRSFTAQDQADAPAVVVINQSLAQRFWPGEDVIGKQMKIGPSDSPNPWALIVGVVGDVRQSNLAQTLQPEVYVSYHQDRRMFAAPRSLVVRTTGDPLTLASAIRDEIWKVDKDLPIYDIQTMEQILSHSVAKQRFNAILLGLFAAVALALASVGIYGVIAYSTARRTHEIGIRMALGAEPGDVLRLVLGQGVRLTLVGVGIGLLSAYGLTRLMATMLYEISATDPFTFAVVALMLTIVALVACYLPARRATKVDPMVALRYE